MISAAEAFKISLENDCTEKQLEQVEECVKKAANNGVYSFVYPGELTDIATNALEDLDYTVRSEFQNGRWYTQIEWGC